jgi:hypothetical protein
MNFLCDTPYVECHVRNEFLYDQAKGQGTYTEATIFGFRAEPARVPMFQVMLASGAQWARIPIHALCIAPCEPLSVDLCAWWDSYGYHAQVHAFAFLRNRLGEGWVVRNQRSAQKPSRYRSRRPQGGGQRAADCIPEQPIAMVRS